MAKPSSEEYWHIGETAILLRKVTSRRASGLSKWTGEGELIDFSIAGGLYRKLTPAYSFQPSGRAHARSMGNQGLRMLLGMAAAVFACAASEGLEWTAQGLQLYRAGRYTEAETMYRRALDSFDRTGEGGSLDRVLTLENIAVTLRAQARYEESEKLHREALPKLEELTGPASLVTARAVSNLAALYWSSGKLEQAEPLALRAETAFHDLPAASPADRSPNRLILASIYLKQHRYADAEKMLRDTVEGSDGVNTVTAYCNLSAAALGLGDNARAEEYSRRAIELAQRELPVRHPLAAVALDDLARACRLQGTKANR